ncbi:MAG TPA: branched-chain amino acid ABC transporter permease [Longimicrobiaceae bacterium]|nr:branched-chain amino acid ABC transporter permease [Longimicrobiaceae bacterium]
MTLFLQQLVNSVALGSIYGLVALGLTLVYGVLRIPNFAHGALYMVGAYATFFFATAHGLSYVAAVGASVLVLALLGAVLERLVFHPLRHAPHLHSMIAALGVLLFLQAGAQLLWGADFRRLPAPAEGVVEIFGLAVAAQRLVVIAAAVAVMAGLYLFLKRTATGAAIEAVAQDREGALLVGIDTRRIAMLTFAVSAGLAAVAASLVAPLNLIYPTMGEVVNLKAFVIIILGGMGSIPGAIVGAYLLAAAEVFGGTYLSSAFAELIGFAVLVAVLAVRPTGLFAKGT